MQKKIELIRGRISVRKIRANFLLDNFGQGNISCAHGQAGMARIGSLHRVHGKGADGVRHIGVSVRKCHQMACLSLGHEAEDAADAPVVALRRGRGDTYQVA